MSGARVAAEIVVTLAVVAAGPADGESPASVGEEVSFPSNDADITGGAPTKLTGRLLRPPGAGPFAAIVALHGCGGPRTREGTPTPRDDDWARRVHALGYVVLLVDSFGPRSLTEICTMRDRPIAQSRERARDAYGALLYLQAQPFVRPDRVALLGWSHGGAPCSRRWRRRHRDGRTACLTAISAQRWRSIPAA